LSIEFYLDNLYDFSHIGLYTIQYVKGILKSSTSTFYYTGPTTFLIQDNKDVALLANCDSSLQATLTEALDYTFIYANESLYYLSSGGQGSRYTLWFGKFSYYEITILQTMFNNMVNVLITQPISFICVCTNPSIYAYVVPYITQTKVINLCGAFWTAPMTGQDSKAGTLIHELSHFYDIGGAQDYVYGTSAALLLATNNYTEAWNNSDNIEYFAENTFITNDGNCTYTHPLSCPSLSNQRYCCRYAIDNSKNVCCLLTNECVCESGYCPYQSKCCTQKNPLMCENSKYNNSYCCPRAEDNTNVCCLSTNSCTLSGKCSLNL